MSHQPFPFVIGSEFTPAIAAIIFEFLDDDTLRYGRTVCKGWKEFIDEKTHFWSTFSSRLFQLAVEDGREDIIRNMVQFAHNPNPADLEGQTPMHTAVLKGKVKILELIIRASEEKNPADFENKWTPLHMAASLGRTECAKVILENIADHSPRDCNGMTPMHFATEMGHAEICELVLQHVKEKHPKDSLDRTPLDLAMYNGHEYIVELFQDLDWGENQDAK